MERLWVVEYHSQNVPNPDFFPDYEGAGIEVVVTDQFGAVVRAEYNELDVLVSRYPYQRITGQPADGRWVNEAGDEVFIYNAELVTEDELRADWQLPRFDPQRDAWLIETPACLICSTTCSG